MQHIHSQTSTCIDFLFWSTGRCNECLASQHAVWKIIYVIWKWGGPDWTEEEVQDVGDRCYIYAKLPQNSHFFHKSRYPLFWCVYQSFFWGVSFVWYVYFENFYSIACNVLTAFLSSFLVTILLRLDYRIYFQQIMFLSLRLPLFFDCNCKYFL